MKTNLIFGLVIVATLGFISSNVRAQDVADATAFQQTSSAIAQQAAPAATTTSAAPAAPAVQAVPGQPCEECGECEGGAGIGLRGRGVGIPRPGIGVPAPGARIKDRIAADRPIVEASPFANPNGSLQDWQRFRYYPYGYYPHNFSDTPNMSVPKYHPGYQNFYPMPRRYHEGHHFLLDVF